MCFGRSCRLQKLFCTDTDFTDQAFSHVERHAYELFIVEYCKSMLAFQLQFGTYEAESEHFRWEKEKRHFNERFSRYFLYFGYLADLRFLKPVFKGILNTLYVFKAVTYVE